MDLKSVARPLFPTRFKNKEYCNDYSFVYAILNEISTQVDLLKRSQGNDLRVDACKVKEHPGQWEDYWMLHHNTRHYIEREIQALESKLSTRLADETYRGLINFLRVTIRDTPIDEIEKALVSNKARMIIYIISTNAWHTICYIFLTFHRNICMMIFPKQSVLKKKTLIRNRNKISVSKKIDGIGFLLEPVLATLVPIYLHSEPNKN